MTLKQRLDKLEQAAPARDDHVPLVWRAVVTRMGDELTQTLHSAGIPGTATTPSETCVRKPGESTQVFVRNVLDRVCVLRNRHDEAFRDGLRWTPNPDYHEGA
jgi:hypothetical protein